MRDLLKGGIFKLYRGANKRLARLLLHQMQAFRPGKHSLEYFGSAENGRTLPSNVVTSDFICYSFGVGTDMSFDIELIKKYQCRVYAFDPTPAAIDYMRSIAPANPSIRFTPVGIWPEDKVLQFFKPFTASSANHSVYDLHGTGEAFAAPCKSIVTIMRENDHDRIDLLKIDIEGAWYPVIKSIIRARVPIKVLCLECDSPNSIAKSLGLIAGLRTLGLRLLHCRKDDALFVRESR